MKKTHPAKQKLAKRLAYTKMRSKGYSYLGLNDELIQLRKNQLAMMEFMLSLRA
jgi:hypothetical protein